MTTARGGRAITLWLFGIAALATGLYGPPAVGSLVRSAPLGTPGPCPPTNNPGVSFTEPLRPEELEARVVRFLRAGGDPKALPHLVEALNVQPGALPGEYGYPGPYYLADVSVDMSDLTGDGQPETVLVLQMDSLDWGGTGVGLILGCVTNQLETLFSIRSRYQVDFKAFTDLTADGLPEAFFTRAVSGISTRPVVIEWAGQEFRPLPFARSGVMRADFVDLDEVFLLFLDATLVKDAAGAGRDGLLVQRQAKRSRQLFSEGPQRDRQETWIWDGEALSLTAWKYEPPVYRFQAVQDGDDYSRLGDFNVALAAYRRVISDSQLQPWSLFDLPGSAFQRHGLTVPEPDPAERSRLAAYASYRMMLVNLLRGQIAPAEKALQSMRQDFPTGVAGYAYLELAEAFWGGYQASQNVAEGCQAAVDHALRRANQVLIPLGMSIYGWRSRDYRPADICPFE